MAKSLARRGNVGRPELVLTGVAAGLLIVAFAAFFVYRSARAGSRPLVNTTVMSPPEPAAGFTLTDQFGATHSLSDFRGKPVALTFIYTHCTDVCPIISASLHQAYLKLGNRAQDVAIVAVTVDPERDDVAQLRAFSDRLGLTNEWSFFTGTRAQLQSVWAAYGVGAQVFPGSANAPERIEHSAPIYLIDKEGQIRGLIANDATAGDIATDLGILLAQR